MNDRPALRPSTVRPARRRRDSRNAADLDLPAFLARLRRMSSEERIHASRYRFTMRERTIWAARFPDEVPLIDGEFEWIAARTPDLE